MTQSGKQGHKNDPTDDDPSTATQLRPRRAWTGLTAFQRDILKAIAFETGTPYGLAIKGRLENWYGEEINHGRLYPNLDELVEDGLIDKSEIDKRTNGYALTRYGERVLGAGADHLDAVRPTLRYQDTTPEDVGDIAETLPEETPDEFDVPETAAGLGFEVTD
ncbi:PadR family transcriptional regulator [Halobellus rufus]|uniref:PadR family transcriptional regulator n=1 Tax=Halobellus rufus TaxID=1448860 RepID=UPI0009E01009|nr:helix-turn-helix transcriptional regulator [Halobellus rufus]